MNLLFGVGSFQQKDKTGGITTAIIEGIGGVSIAVGIMNAATIGPEIGAYSLYTELAVYLVTCQGVSHCFPIVLLTSIHWK